MKQMYLFRVVIGGDREVFVSSDSNSYDNAIMVARTRLRREVWKKTKEDKDNRYYDNSMLNHDVIDKMKNDEKYQVTSISLIASESDNEYVLPSYVVDETVHTHKSSEKN